MALPFLMEVEMKIEDMIMVIENRKGIETNMLCTMSEFVVNFVLGGEKQQVQILEEAMKLRDTKHGTEWYEEYYSSNVSVNARFCAGEAELRLFLKGIYNDTPTGIFSEERSSEACLKHLEKIGIRLDGSLENVNTMRYEKLSKEFVQGEDLYNLNGVTYKLLEKYSDKNFLLMDKATGNFVVGLGVDFFAKYPRSEGKESEDCVYGIEWGHGVYLGTTPSEIDFAGLRKEYGETEREVEQEGKKAFDIEITETLQKIQTIEAECLGDAIDKAMDMYYGQQIVLDAEDMKDVEFNQYKDSVEAQGKRR